MENIIKIVWSLEDSGLLIKAITQTIEAEREGQKGGFLGILLGALGRSLLRNMLAGKQVNRASEGVNRIVFNRAGQDF